MSSFNYFVFIASLLIALFIILVCFFIIVVHDIFSIFFHIKLDLFLENVYNVIIGIFRKYLKAVLNYFYQFATIARWESHFISRITFVKKICFPNHKIKEGFKESLNSTGLLTNCQIKFIKPILEHSSLKFFKYI
jgi:hypothetical protein